MDRTILLSGSFCAALLILLASFSNVVGYDVLTSPSTNESPLFSIRKQNAINQNEENRIISKYLGKGEPSAVMISKRTNTFEKAREVISRITLMDDASFNMFVTTIVHEFSQQENKNDVDLHKILYELNQIRSPSKTLGGKEIYSDEDRTWRSTPTLCWIPGCLIVSVTAMTLLLIFFIIYFGFLHPTTFPSCDPYGCPHASG